MNLRLFHYILYLSAALSFTVHAHATCLPADAPVIAYIGDIRKSLNCEHTGMVTIVVADGKAPYKIQITNAPAGYGGTLEYTLNSAGSRQLDNLLPGYYEFKVTDQAAAEILLPFTMQTVPSDIPTDAYYDYIYPVQGASCTGAVVIARNVLQELDYYWNQHRHTYYEVAYVVNGTSSGWLPTEKGARDTVVLPHSLKQLQDNSYSIAVHLKMKNCSSERLNADVISVYPNQAIEFSNRNMTCSNFDASFSPFNYDADPQYDYSYRTLLCYPYSWEMRESDGTPVASKSGIQNEEEQTAAGLEYDKTYTLTFIDSEGTKIEQAITTENKLTARWYKTFCMPHVHHTALQLYKEGSKIPAGTIIRQISGPSVARHNNITLSEDLSEFYPFSNSYKVYENVAVENGVYVFEITNICGDPPYNLTVDYRQIEIRNLSYTTENACDGLHVFPTGEIYNDGVRQSCYYQLIEAPDGVNVSNAPKIADSETGRYFVLPKPGQYAFSISHWNSDCAADTVVIDYQPPALAFDNQIMYACHTGGTPNFILTATNGIAPYTYELYENGSRVASNTTGQFIYGNYTQNYAAKVIDVCGKTFTADLQMTDLAIENVIGGPENVCLGDTIALTCMGLGASGFLWSGPNGYSSTSQNPKLPNATTGNEGKYTVTFLPMGCATPLSQSLNVAVYTTPMPVYADSVQFCLNGTAVIADAPALPGHTVYWLASDGVTRCPKPSISTSSVHIEKYYLVQQENQLGCLSQKQEVVINVNALPSSDIMAIAPDVCPLTAPVITIQGSLPGYRYEVYAEQTATNRLITLTGTGDEVSGTLPVIISEPTTYYVKVHSLLCTAAQMKEVPASIKHLTISPNLLPAYVFDEPYNVQLVTNAVNPTYSYTGDLPPTITFSPSGLFSGIVPYSPTMPYKYITVTATDAGGCSTTKDYVLRTCAPAPYVPVDSVLYCAGALAQPLEASSPTEAPLQWYDENLTKIDTAPTPNTYLIGEQTYYVAQIDTTLNCEGDKAKITVIVNPAPDISFYAKAERICYRTSPTIELYDLNASYSYSIYTDLQLTNKLITVTGVEETRVELDVILEKSTPYYVSVADNLGCPATQSLRVGIDVINFDILPAELPAYRKDIAYEQVLRTDANEPIFSLVAGRLPTGLSFTPNGRLSGIVPYSDETVNTYITIQIKDMNDCKKRQSYILTAELFIPKVFTPNNDGVNDVFMPEHRVIIFNRMGITVFEGDSGWDGTYNGKEAEAGIYFYKVYYKEETGTTQTKAGYIGLER